ncbi:hypothetical protein Btru_033032 [Bulinus truncatus]|nr:hypothetical protein Btru_033032 [Bulinus truncatus]
MDSSHKDTGGARNSPASKNGTASAATTTTNNNEDENASSDMNEVDFDKNDIDSVQGSPKADKKRVVKKKVPKPSAKLILDKKKLEQYVGEGEVLVPVPRARRRLKGNDLGYMVKCGDEVVRYIDKDRIVYNPNDTAYLQNREKGKPYFVCAIQRFNLTKRDTLMVGIKWFFRLSEVPGSVYHHLTLDRELHRKVPDTLAEGVAGLAAKSEVSFLAAPGETTQSSELMNGEKEGGVFVSSSGDFDASRTVLNNRLHWTFVSYVFNSGSVQCKPFLAVRDSSVTAR